jgi:hypothetical protein
MCKRYDTSHLLRTRHLFSLELARSLWGLNPSVLEKAGCYPFTNLHPSPLEGSAGDLLHASRQQNHMIYQSPTLENYAWFLFLDSIFFRFMGLRTQQCTLLTNYSWMFPDIPDKRVRCSCAAPFCIISHPSFTFHISHSLLDQDVSFPNGGSWHQASFLHSLWLAPRLLG